MVLSQSIVQQPLYLVYIGSEGQNKKSKHIKRRLCVVSNKMYPKEGGILWYKSAAITIKSWQFGELWDKKTFMGQPGGL